MEGATQVLIESGLGWAVSVLLGGALVLLYKRNNTILDQKDVLQEKRLEDMKELLDKYNEAQGKTSQTLELLNAKITRGGKE